MNIMPFVLASASPRRAALLRQLGRPFEVVPGQIEEMQCKCLTPKELCQINAYRKAWGVARQRPDALVLGADTLVFQGQEIFGKPRSMAEAARMLARLAGQTHEVVTGICLVHLRGQRHKVFAVSTQVTFRPLTAADIRNYLANVDPLDKAGAYAIQEQGHLLVERIAGSYSNVVGLPLEQVREAIAHWQSQALSLIPRPLPLRHPIHHLAHPAAR